MALFRLRSKTKDNEVPSSQQFSMPIHRAHDSNAAPRTDDPNEANVIADASNPGGTNERPEDVIVSVVIPVYNSMPYLTELMNSLEMQDLDKALFEVIAVDDGSTDFGGDILDAYEKRNSNFFVVHQANSGWPGKPRNVGMAKARGQYVFFVDGDDRLGPEALRRMTTYARKHDVDVLVPKMVGIDGRRAPVKLFERTIRDVSYDFILRTLSPQKMVRKSLLDAHGIRFIEEKVRLEDGMVMVEAYSVANRISILADYNYYEIRRRSDGQNISTQQIEPAGYVSSLSKIAQAVKVHAGDDIEVGRKQIAGLFKRKGLSFYRGQRFLRLDEAQRTSWVRSHATFLERFGLTDPEATFNKQDALRVRAILDCDLSALERLAQQEVEAQRPPEAVRIEVTEELVELTVEFPAEGPRPVSARVTDRDSAAQLETEISIDTVDSILTARFIREAILSSVTRLGDIFLVYPDASTKRIKLGQKVSTRDAGGIRVYGTGNGFLSLDRRRA
ncbi:glycosyltransferase [Glutamicibacter sp. JC586]|uniref:glycosyltransferase family 2 protein n=1 Tax=Glutamicibacter sp. JC586 TaxID=2590552 RepID=UPI001356D4F0|nr:glycosyltransferase [Glutamicibacter sp. JC586]